MATVMLENLLFEFYAIEFQVITWSNKKSLVTTIAEFGLGIGDRLKFSVG